MARILEGHAERERVARCPGWDVREELAHIADLGRERLRELVPEQPAELLQMRPAARGVDDDELDVAERVDQPARERLPLLESSRVDRQCAAATLGRRDDLEAVGGGGGAAREAL